jgi:hypothetical protein
MRQLRKKAVGRVVAGLAAVAAIGVATASQADPGDYCAYADGYVYCGTEEFIYEGDPRLWECLQRWEVASWSCPPGFAATDASVIRSDDLFRD